MFEPIDKLELWDGGDYWVIQYIRKDTPFVSSMFLIKHTSAKVKVLCEFFGIPYDPHWVIYSFGDVENNGAQITINKPKDMIE